MKRLAAMHDWPVLMRACFNAGCHAVLQIRARHDDERIAAAEFEHAFLDLSRGGARDALPARSLPVSVTAFTRGSSITCAVCSASISNV